MRATTKRGIVRRISSTLGTDQMVTKRVVQGFLDTIMETLLDEGRLELRNFGVFELRKRAARVARNPRTNEPIMLRPRTAVTFQPSKRFSRRVAEKLGEPLNARVDEMAVL